MIKYILATVICFVAAVYPIQLYSQKGPREKGMVITSDGDTLAGNLMENSDLKLAGQVTFYPGNDPASLTVYTTAELKKFAFSYGRTFERFSSSSFVPADSVESAFFAKKILTGRIDLYVQRTTGNMTGIILRNNSTGKMVHLKQPQKTKVENEKGEQVEIKDRKYMGLLTVIKTDSAQPVILTPEDLRYSLKEIKNNILQYNQRFQNKYPSREYRERKLISYEVSGGMNLIPWGEGYDVKSFRVSGYRNRTNIEKNRNLTLIQGLTFNYLSEKDSSTIYRNETYKYNRIFFNLIPVGVKLQTRPGSVTGYAYIGIGVGMLIDVSETYKEDVLSYTDKDLIPLPLAVIGLGAKIKAGPVGILAEVVPAYNGIFFNLGLNFLEHFKQ